MTLHNVIIFLKSVLNKDNNHYHCKIFLKKIPYHLVKKNNDMFFRWYVDGEIWR